MSNVSSNSPIENIGALELGRASVLMSDDALEATAASLAAPTSANNCGTIWPCAHRIDDGVLENAAVIVTAGPTIAPCTVMTCPRIDDGALEAAMDALSASPTNSAHSCATSPFYCSPHIDDGALEAAAVATLGPTIQYCNTLVGANCPRRIDDCALEAVAVTGPGQTIMTYCVCPRVDDGELEATAGILHANPTGAGNICNMSGPLMCPRRIDDGVH